MGIDEAEVLTNSLKGTGTVCVKAVETWHRILKAEQLDLTGKTRSDVFKAGYNFKRFKVWFGHKKTKCRKQM